MQTCQNRPRWGISPEACLGMSLLLLVLPLRWLLACCLAGVFHELCHIAAIKACGSRIWNIEIGFGGAVLETEPMSRGKELFCALAGPVGGLALLLLARWLPRLAICGAMQSLYNLLPIYPLDGGRALRCAMELLLPLDKAEKLCRVVAQCCVAGILLLAVYGTFIRHLGLFPLLLALCLTLKLKKSCKR